MGLRDWVRNWLNQPIQGVTPPGMSTRALAGGRITKDRPQLAAWRTAILPPPDYESDWQMMALDDRTLSRLTPTRLLEMMVDLSPEVSSALWHFLRLCNPGWEVKARRPGSDAQDARAQVAAEDFLDLLKRHYGSADIVFNRLHMSAFLRGAVFGELVINRAGNLPVDIATPDPVTVRFKEVEDADRGTVWVPGQWQPGGFVTFEDETIRYLPVDPFPGSPYGRPLVSPALFTALFLLSMMHDLKRVIQQQGYPRLDIAVDFAALAEQMPQESGVPGWANQVRAAIETAYAALQPEDAFVHDANITINRPVGTVDSSSLGAVDALINALERMAARALKSTPLLMGIEDAGSEVQSNRQWEIQAAGIKSIQHLTESLMEHFLQLGLQAQGIQADITFRFAELRAAEQMRDAQTEQMRIDNARKKWEAGWISQDEASEEVTGHKADSPEPRTQSLGAQFQTGADLSEDRRKRISTRLVPVEPEGADEPLPDIPAVDIGPGDVGIAWDEVMADIDSELVGLLDAVVSEEERSIRTRAPGDSPWVWEPRLRRYRHRETGRFIGASQMESLHGQFTDAMREHARDLSQRLAAGDITVQQWTASMRERTKQAFVDLYALSRGGRNAMTQQDYGRIGALVRRQYGYLQEFAGEIQRGELSAAQIANRAQSYMQSAGAAFERGKAAAAGLILPDYPRSGNTRCRSNCLCSWSIEETDTEWRCVWNLSRAENCDDCIENSRMWNPLIVPKLQARTLDELHVHLNGLEAI